MMTISKLMSSRRRRKYSHVHSLYLHHLLARPLLLCCHSSKENALNFSRFYEDKWEIKRNEVVCSYWWWKSNLLCPFRVSSSLFFIGKGDIYGISLRNFALLTSSKGDPFSCEIWYYVGLTLSQVTSTRSKKCQSSSIAKSQLPNFFLPSW